MTEPLADIGNHPITQKLSELSGYLKLMIDPHSPNEWRLISPDHAQTLNSKTLINKRLDGVLKRWTNYSEANDYIAIPEIRFKDIKDNSAQKKILAQNFQDLIKDKYGANRVSLLIEEGRIAVNEQCPFTASIQQYHSQKGEFYYGLSIHFPQNYFKLNRNFEADMEKIILIAGAWDREMQALQIPPHEGIPPVDGYVLGYNKHLNESQHEIYFFNQTKGNLDGTIAKY